MAIPKYLTKALKEGNVMNIAQALARYHAPSVHFVATLSRADSFYDHEENVKPLSPKRRVDENLGKLLRWSVFDGLTSLLHELGHHKYRHKDYPCCDGHELWEEAEAWLWAEKWAHRYGIAFDYNLANKRFCNYQKGRGMIAINWAHPNGAGGK